MSLPETYKALFVAANPGEKPTIREIPLPKPGQDQVLIKMEFAPINYADIKIMGAYMPNIPAGSKLAGYEGSGTVVAVGQDLRIPFKVGDRVHVIGPGTMGQYLVTDTKNVYPIQGDLSFEEAASHYGNPTTAHYIAYVAEKGNHKAVIQTAASSALGKMLIRFLKIKGIKSINVVRKDEYIEDLKKEGGDYVLNSTDPDFEAKLKEIAAKEEATMAVDAIAGDFSGKILSCQPPNSIVYLYGILSGTYAATNISIGDLFQGKKVAGLTQTTYFAELEQKGELRKMITEVHSLLPNVLNSRVQKVFKLEEVEEAVEHYSANASKGRVLLRLN